MDRRYVPIQIMLQENSFFENNMRNILNIYIVHSIFSKQEWFRTLYISITQWRLLRWERWGCTKNVKKIKCTASTVKNNEKIMKSVSLIISLFRIFKTTYFSSSNWARANGTNQGNTLGKLVLSLKELFFGSEWVCEFKFRGLGRNSSWKLTKIWKCV